jgi:light-regulated signal transduction histidine kinase (bacteriophytochrome)
VIPGLSHNAAAGMDGAPFDAQSYASALLNILDDAGEERAVLQNAQQAVLNILEDSVDEAGRLADTQRAVLNILDDFEVEKAKVERSNLNLRQEVAARELAVEALRRSNVAAEAANRELEAFSYSVAHDLRAPLRSIDGFSHALLEDYGDKLDEDGKTHLRYVREAAQHMAQLITDLLSLSRVTRADFQRASLDLAALSRKTLAILARNHPARAVEAVMPAQLEVFGDVRLLEIAVENLLSNAWKFTSKAEGARIEIGQLVQTGKPVYFIRDNGAGFDMAHAGKLFAVFQRLHAPSEFEGVGIGLATVERIIHRHGGRIWAEGEVGKGATFYFTIEEES